MRKEYTLSTFSTDFFDSIDDFFSNFTSLYTLIDSQSDRRVYHNVSENLDLIFYYVSSYDKIALIVTPEYNSSNEIWYQDKIVNLGYDYARSNIAQNGSSYLENAAYYIPAPTVMPGQKLVANYNKENQTFMFTVIRDVVFDYGYTSSTVARTMSICFGTMTKYLSFDGGFFYGGDFMLTYERYYRELVIIDIRTGQIVSRTKVEDDIFVIYDSCHTDIRFHIQPVPLGSTTYWGSPWVSNPYTNKECCCRNKSHMPEPNHINRFECILRADIDNAVNRRRNELIVATPDVSFMPTYRRTDIWAITMENNDYYVPMVCSITASTVPLPRYEPLIAHGTIEKGHTVNTLNNITTIMPLWFMVMRDPQVLTNYSGAGKNDIINFVDMYNMFTDRIENGTFPIIDSYEYDCFHMGNRRSMYGMRGYSGLAFRQEPELKYDPNDPTTYPDWLLYPQNLSTCGIVQSHESKPGFHFFPDTSLLDDSDYILFLFDLQGIGIVYFRIDTSNILSALNSNIVYELTNDAMVYISNETSLPLLPDIPSSSNWQSVSSVSALNGMGFDLRDYATKSHLMFLGNTWFMSKFVDGEAYLCKD